MTLKNMVHVTLTPEEWDREDEVMATEREIERELVVGYLRRIAKTTMGNLPGLASRLGTTEDFLLAGVATMIGTADDIECGKHLGN